MATARFCDVADGIEDKLNVKLFSIRCTSEWCGLKNKLPIQRCCRKETKIAGIHPTLNIDLSWMYYKDYFEEFGEVVKSA